MAEYRAGPLVRQPTHPGAILRGGCSAGAVNQRDGGCAELGGEPAGSASGFGRTRCNYGGDGCAPGKVLPERAGFMAAHASGT
jgi:hypothetical protein